jgi:hypothetical protein
MSLPTQEYLKSRIDYDPETGEAKWKPVDESYGRTWRGFNRNYANKTLGTSTQILGKSYLTSFLIYKMTYNTDVTRLGYANNNKNDLRLSNLVKTVNKSISNARVSENFKPAPPDIDDLLEFCKTSGSLVWKPRLNAKTFNARYAGNNAGYLHESGYIRLSIHNEAFLAHRIIWAIYYGVDPVNYIIDHIDGNGENNNISNLRLANRSLNNTNIHKKPISGYSGDKTGTCFEAKISVNNTTIHLGSFTTQAEAQAAYDRACEKYKPTYKFTDEEQQLLDELYATYPNCTVDLQRSCHELQVKALKFYVDAAIVQGPNLTYNSSP